MSSSILPARDFCGLGRSQGAAKRYLTLGQRTVGPSFTLAFSGERRMSAHRALNAERRAVNVSESHKRKSKDDERCDDTVVTEKLPAAGLQPPRQ